ncbi:hypothetical protein MP638_005055 [Amoeboaphelidium occidentale]|nr:hypothetical protein MP638_005055 [Amoeboaphelidium occidentale]
MLSALRTRATKPQTLSISGQLRFLSTSDAVVEQKAKKHLPPTSQTVNVQLPPTTIPWESFQNEPRVKPTRTGYVPKNDMAYEGWSDAEDKKLVDIMMNSVDGKLRNYDKIATVHFPDKRPRDIRMRWNTYLRPQRMLVDKNVSELWKMKKAYGDEIEIIDGRWCHVPKGIAQYQPSDKYVSYRPYRPMARYDTGLTVLEIMSQKVAEQEELRRQKARASAESRNKTFESKKNDIVILEEVEWTKEEDMVLREGLEMFGNQWDKISNALRSRKRTPDECRERMELLCSRSVEA